jgi:hypothetical protein
MIVLDTNTLSEALKPSPSEIVLRWLAAQERSAVFIITVTQAEVLYGIEFLPAGKHRGRLSAIIEKLFAEEFPGRILTFDEESARAFAKIVTGRKAAGRPISQTERRGCDAQYQRFRTLWNSTYQSMD